MWSSSAHLLKHLRSLILAGDAFRPFKVLSGGLKKESEREKKTKGDISQAGEDEDNKRLSLADSPQLLQWSCSQCHMCFVIPSEYMLTRVPSPGAAAGTLTHGPSAPGSAKPSIHTQALRAESAHQEKSWEWSSMRGQD